LKNYKQIKEGAWNHTVDGARAAAKQKF